MKCELMVKSLGEKKENYSKSVVEVSCALLYDVSWKLPTYPSPKPTFCPKLQVSVNVDLIGEG